MNNQREVQQYLSEGKTAIMVAVDGRVIGMLFAADTVRPAASAAVAALRQRGLDVKVVSGDRKEAVWAVAAAAMVPKEATSWEATPGEVGCCICSVYWTAWHTYRYARSNLGVGCTTPSYPFLPFL